MLRIQSFPVLKHCALVSMLLLAMLFSGCKDAKYDQASAGWKPIAPVGLHLTRKEKGLWEASAGIPVDGMGVFALGYKFDAREKYTYVILRNPKNGTDQVFRLGLTANIKCHVTGEHNLTIHTEGENKFIIEDEVISGNLSLKIYPEGQELARANMANGPEFVFLTGNRLHVEYRSFRRMVKDEKLSLDLGSAFSSDDDFSLNSLQSITYKKDFRERKIVLEWKSGLGNQSEPIEINVPMNDEVDQDWFGLQRTVKRFAPNVEFREVTFSDGVAGPFWLATICFLLLCIITVFSDWDSFGCTIFFLGTIFVIGMFASVLHLMSDAEVFEIVRSKFTWTLASIGLVTVFGVIIKTIGRSSRRHYR